MKLQNYDTQSLTIIDQSSILEPEDFKAIVKLKGELNHTFLRSQLFRTRTEMEVSVLDDIHFPTPDSKYWQAKREQNTHYTELVILSYEYRKNIIEIKMMERDLASEQDDLKAELIKIEIDKKNFIKLQHERTAKDRIREIKSWSEIMKNLEPQLKYSKDEVNEHQLISYAREFIREAMSLNETTGIAERNNMVGKLVTTVKSCKNNGVWDLVKSTLTANEIQFLKVNGLET